MMNLQAGPEKSPGTDMLHGTIGFAARLPMEPEGLTGAGGAGGAVNGVTARV